MKDNEQELSNTKRSKKVYSQPHLQVYGDLRGITQALAGTSKNLDGPKMAQDKTN